MAGEQGAFDGRFASSDDGVCNKQFGLIHGGIFAEMVSAFNLFTFSYKRRYREGMKTLQQWLDEYSLDHQNSFNQKIHLVCVPLIFTSVVSMVQMIPYEVGGYRVGGFVLSLFMLWYMTLNVKAILIMFAQMLLAIGIAVGVEYAFPDEAWYIFGGVFVLAWMGQFWGHKKEGRKPAFFKDLQYLLIGPLWVWLGHKKTKV